MTIRVRYKSRVLLSDSIQDDNWAGQPEASVLSDDLDDGGTIIFTIEAADADIELKPSKPASLNLIYLKIRAVDPNEVLGSLMVSLNDGDPVALTPLPGAKEAEWKLCTADITSVKVSNEGTVDIKLIFSYAGLN